MTDTIVAGPVPVSPGGPVEQRVAALEAVMATLLHFITANLRPDLSAGALSQEEDQKKTPPEEKKDQ